MEVNSDATFTTVINYNSGYICSSSPVQAI